MSNDPKDTVVDWRKLIKKAPPIRLQTEPKNDNNLITSLNEGEKNLRGYEMSTLGKTKNPLGMNILLMMTKNKRGRQNRTKYKHKQPHLRLLCYIVRW